MSHMKLTGKVSRIWKNILHFRLPLPVPGAASGLMNLEAIPCYFIRNEPQKRADFEFDVQI